MSFIVRQISRTAEGREIVRPRRFDQDELTIGRNTASDVHLADLAVTLDHALIRRVDRTRIEIVSINNLPFEVDGRSTAHAQVDASRGAIIRIGGHSLTVSMEPEAVTIQISVERVEALSEASEAKDEARAFGLAGTVPPKRATAWLLVLAIVAAFLAWPIWSFYQSRETARPAGASASAIAAARGDRFHADSNWSSGPLSLAHRSLENNCQACHVKPFEAVRDETCASCHAQVHDHADPTRLAAAKAPVEGFGKVRVAFQSAFGIPQGRCVECHTEHEGAKEMPVTQQRFCSDCHAGLNQRLPDTRIGNAGDFGRDHPQFRPAVIYGFEGGKPLFRRVSLDAAPKEENGLKFPHRLHLSSTNSVAQMARSLAGEQGWGEALACKDCHVAEAGGSRFRPVDMETNCGACHSLAFDRTADGTVRTLRHGEPRQVVAELRDFYRLNGPSRPAVLGGMARRRPGDAATARSAADYYLAVGRSGGSANAAIRAVFSEGGACYDCHKIERATDPRTLNFAVAPVVQPARYMAKGWFDHAAHKGETCQSCHAAGTSDSATDLLLPGIGKAGDRPNAAGGSTCRSCHGGEASSAEVPSSCAMCHDYHIDGGRPTMVRDGRIGQRRERTTSLGERSPSG